MENKKNMKAIDILKEALKVFANNANFILFTALTSLPLFFFSLYFQNLFHGFFFQASQSLPMKNDTITESELTLRSVYEFLPEYNATFTPILNSESFTPKVQLSIISVERYPNFDWSRPVDLVRNLSRDQFLKLLHLGFLYLAPFNLLQLVTVILVVDLSSKLYREEKALTFKDMLGVRFSGERLRGVFVTFLYVVVFTVCTLTGFVWLALTYSAVLDYYPRGSDFYVYGYYYYNYNYINPLSSDIWFHLQYGTNLVLLLGIHLGWGSIWNLGLVVSVLEGKFGAKAIGSSGYLCLRNVQNGMVLTLVFSILEMGFWVPSFLFNSFDGYKTWAVIVAQSGLLCFGNAIKWVGLVVYFDTCIKKLFAKKVDVEEQA